MTTAPRAYAITPAHDLVTLGRATSQMIAPGAPTPDPPPDFGEIRTPTPGALSTAPPVLRYVFHNAVVHGPQGAITVGRHVVAESLGHTPAPFAIQHGALWMTRHDYIGTSLSEAEHLLCAVPANYFHWMLDGYARRVALPLKHAPILLPGTGAPFQPIPNARLIVDGESIAVTRLGWSTTLTSNGGAYHPVILDLPKPAPNGPPDLYIARTDATNRPLRNEAAIQNLCESRGFTPVTLAGMTLTDQAALFAAARRIIAPHGAGLANLIFCAKGTAVLELMMDQYANFCFRRLAATAALRWGAVIGHAESGNPDWIHRTAWSLDPDRLSAVLDDPAFTLCP